MYRIAIVEDEEKCVQHLSEILERCSKELNVQCKVECFNNGMDFISDYQPLYDLVLLDIAMPLLDGMETARKLRAIDPAVFIIFTTNLVQYAVKSYEVEALDFVLKPVEFKVFFTKFKRFVKMMKEKKDKYIVISTEGISRKINVKDILYIEVIGHFLHYHLYGETLTKYGTIAQAENEMENFGFFRIYKSYIINLSHIQEIKLNSVVLDDGTELLISRFKKKEFMQKVAEYFGNRYM